MTSEFDKLDIEAIVKGQFDFKKRYSDLQVIGEGGMGKVFRAHDNKLAKPVAIKFLHSHADFKIILRFQQEARALSRLNHQFIVQILDFQHSEEGELFLVMEYVPGKSLESILEEKGALPFGDAIRYAIQLCDALEHAHAREIVHRDLKPSNVLIDANNNVRILDFGLAKLFLTDDQFGTLTRPGQMLGTPLYMSPEQVRGEAADLRADVYGLGTILYSMLAGRTPWDGEQLVVMFREKVSGEPPSLKQWIGDTEAARELDRIVATALRNDPEQRFQNMHLFRQALSEVVIDPVERRQITAQPKSRRLTSTTIIIAGIILSLISAAAFFSSHFYYTNVKAPIDADLRKVAPPLTSLTSYGVVQSSPMDASADKTSADKKVRRTKKEKDPIPGFFKQKEYREQEDFWFARPFVDDETLGQLDPRIRALSLIKNTRFTDDGLRAIPVQQLKKIDLTETKISNESLKILGQMQNLMWIRLNCTAITDDGIKNLAPLGKQLERLDLDQCRGFTNSGLRFVLKTFPKLYALHIGDTSVTRDSIKLLGEHHNLQEIWLSSLNATDDDVRAISHLELGLLDLTSCRQVTDEIFKILADQPRLGYIELVGCPKITASGINSWKRRFPHSEVHWQDAKQADNLTDSGLFDAPEGLE